MCVRLRFFDFHTNIVTFQSFHWVFSQYFLLAFTLSHVIEIFYHATSTIIRMPSEWQSHTCSFSTIFFSFLFEEYVPLGFVQWLMSSNFLLAIYAPPRLNRANGGGCEIQGNHRGKDQMYGCASDIASYTEIRYHFGQKTRPVAHK